MLHKLKNSIRDTRTPQPGEIVFNTMRYKSSETAQTSDYFQSNVSYIKVLIMSVSTENNVYEKENVCKDKVLKQDNSIAREQH